MKVARSHIWYFFVTDLSPFSAFFPVTLSLSLWFTLHTHALDARQLTYPHDYLRCKTELSSTFVRPFASPVRPSVQWCLCSIKPLFDQASIHPPFFFSFVRVFVCSFVRLFFLCSSLCSTVCCLLVCPSGNSFVRIFVRSFILLPFVRLFVRFFRLFLRSSVR